MDELIAKTESFVRETLSAEGSGHDWWHCRRVWRLAVGIAEREGGDRTLVALAALLHDIADWKLHDGDTEAGPRRAKAWLEEAGADPAVVEAVCAIIRGLSFKGAAVEEGTLSLEGRIVQDADRLDALGAIGVGRAFAYGGFRERSMHEPGAKPVLHTTADSYRNSRGTTINHFYEKLLLLKDRMHTQTARRIAEERHAFMERFLEQFYREWDAPVDG